MQVVKSNTVSIKVALILWSVQVTQENQESGGPSLSSPQAGASEVKKLLVNNCHTDAATQLASPLPHSQNHTYCCRNMIWVLVQVTKSRWLGLYILLIYHLMCLQVVLNNNLRRNIIQHLNGQGNPSLLLISCLFKLFCHYKKKSFEPGKKVHVYNYQYLGDRGRRAVRPVRACLTQENKIYSNKIPNSLGSGTQILNPPPWALLHLSTLSSSLENRGRHG